MALRSVMSMILRSIAYAENHGRVDSLYSATDVMNGSMEHVWISLQQRRCLLTSTSAGNVKEICKLLFFPVDNCNYLTIVIISLFFIPSDSATWQLNKKIPLNSYLSSSGP